MGYWIACRITVECDAPGCTEEAEFEVFRGKEGEEECWDKAFAAGWKGGPAAENQYCPTHKQEEAEATVTPAGCLRSVVSWALRSMGGRNVRKSIDRGDEMSTEEEKLEHFFLRRGDYAWVQVGNVRVRCLKGPNQDSGAAPQSRKGQGMNEFKILVERQGKRWAAQWLEYDIATEADTVEAAIRDIIRMVCAFCNMTRQENRDKWAVAPRGYWEEWDQSNVRLRLLQPQDTAPLSFEIRLAISV